MWYIRQKVCPIGGHVNITEMAGKRTYLFSTIAVVMVTGIIFTVYFMSASKMGKVGDIAPEFILPNQHGQVVSLSQFKGSKNVVLFFYPKDETPGCTKEACKFRDEYEVFTDLGAEVIGISSDGSESHKSFAENHRLPYDLLSDRGGNVRKLYGVPNTFFLLPGRVTFVIDKEGIIRHVFNSQFNSEQHIDQALAALKSM